MLCVQVTEFVDRLVVEYQAESRRRRASVQQVRIITSCLVSYRCASNSQFVQLCAACLVLHVCLYVR